MQNLTAAHIQELLVEAEARGLSHEIIEKLQWFLVHTEKGTVSAVCRQFGIARTTYYRWLRRFDPANLRTLEEAGATSVQTRTVSDVRCLGCRMSVRFRNASNRSLVILLFLSVLCNLAALLLFFPPIASASNWTPGILVNTEAFSNIDDSDATANIEMRFGQGLGEKIYFDRAASLFHVTDDLFVGNGLEVADTMSGGALDVMRAATFANGSIAVTATGSLGIGAPPNSARFYIKGGGAGQKFRYETSQSEYSFRIGGNFTGAADEVTLTAGAAVQSHTADTASPAWAIGFSGLSDYLAFARGQNNGEGNAVTWTQHLRMDDAGDVGIGLGASNAKTKLEVGGTVSGSTLTFMGGSSYVLGNLSIGTSSPAKTKLEVSGTASGTNLFATKSISGTNLYASATFAGAGLSNCTGTSNKLT